MMMLKKLLLMIKNTQVDLYKFVKHIAPEYIYKVHYYAGPHEIFEKFDINKEIEEALSRKTFMKSGGSIIIETTEAMTVIDVNTGKYIGKANLEETILKTNLRSSRRSCSSIKIT